jgi:hypothetical protein
MRAVRTMMPALPGKRGSIRLHVAANAPQAANPHRQAQP